MTNYRPLPELSLSYKVDPTTHNKEMTVQFLQTVNRQLAAEANPVRYKDLLIARDNASQIIELIDKEREVLLENQRNKEQLQAITHMSEKYTTGSTRLLVDLMANDRVDSYKVTRHNQGFGPRYLHTIMSVNGEKVEHLTTLLTDGLSSCIDSAKGWQEKAAIRPPVPSARFQPTCPSSAVPATPTVPIVVNLTPQQIEEFGRHTSGNYPNHLKREIAAQIARKYDQVIVASYSPSTGIKKTTYEPSTFKRHAEQLVRETGVNPYVCVILGSGDQVMMTAEHHMLYMKDTNKIPQFGAASLTGR
jgi:hypothetical protein